MSGCTSFPGSPQGAGELRALSGGAECGFRSTDRRGARAWNEMHALGAQRATHAAERGRWNEMHVHFSPTTRRDATVGGFRTYSVRFSPRTRGAAMNGAKCTLRALPQCAVE